MSTETRSPFYLRVLKEELDKRCKANSRYSLRAFARHLDIDAGTLSSILNSKRPLSFKQATDICQKLLSGKKNADKFLTSVVLSQKKRPLKRRDPKINAFEIKKDLYKTAKTLDVELFQIISEWYHAAILELTYRKDFQSNPAWVAKELGINTIQAKIAIDRLLELELLFEDTNGRLQKSNDHLELPLPKQTNEARKAKQKQIRQKAIEAVDNVPVQKRHMASITMCIDPALLEEAKKRIEDFNDSLCAFLESGERKAVYSMEIGLFPLQVLEGETK